MSRISPEPLIAVVENGRLVLDVPTDLPEGTREHLRVDDEGDDELLTELRESIRQCEAGNVIDGDVVMAELRARCSGKVSKPNDAPRHRGDFVRGPEFVHEYASRRGFVTTAFDRWVASNNISRTFKYRNGWWGYVETIRKLRFKFALTDVDVVGHYIVDTPPPQEQLPMPAVRLSREGVDLVVKLDFGAKARWPFEWTVSVRRQSPYLGPLFGLFDPERDLREAGVDGFGEWLFGSYRDNPAVFTCDLIDEQDVAALFRLVLFEL